MCRHCPFGYSNVKGVDPSSNAHAIATSGDREGTSLCVEKIMNGTYYEEQCFDACGEQHQTDDCGGQLQTDGTANAKNVQNEQMTQTETMRGEGGYAGGTLTNKNVPYTRKGDTGTSQLFTGERRSKDDVVFEAMGTVDELCCIVGTVYADLVKNDTTTNDADVTSTNNNEANASSHQPYGELPDQLLDVMSRLFDVGSHIARPSASKEKQSKFPSHHSTILEEWIDTMTEQLPELTSFILPTGSPASASLHVARTVCRRAERRMVPLIRDYDCCDPNSLAYVNRLSDYLFTAARFVNYCDGKDEVQYRRERGVKSSEIGGRKRVVVRLKD